MDTFRSGSMIPTAVCGTVKCISARILALGLAGFVVFSSPAAAQVGDLSDLAARVMDAVVNISTTIRPTGAQSPAAQGQLADPALPRRSLGSGFIIDPSGIIITNEHVIRNGDEIDVILRDGTRLRAELVGEDSYIDVAVLRVRPNAPLAMVKFADSDQIRVGQPVMAIGNPSGLGGTVTAGIVSAKNRDIRTGPFDNFIQTDASINRGNSGGPLFNMAGDVIGINTLGLTPSGGSVGLNFAVPANTAQPIIAQLREFGETRRGWLGVDLQELTPEIAEALRLAPPRGVLLSGVDPRGPAAPAGLRAGDVIVNFNGQEIRDPSQLQRVVAEATVGSVVPVTVVRDGRSTQLTATLARREAPASSTSAVAALGMQVSGITRALQSELELRNDLRGVVVVAVEPGSQAAAQGIRPGTVITEVQNEAVDSPGNFVRRVEALKAEGRRSAVILVLAANGQTRLIALNLA